MSCASTLNRIGRNVVPAILIFYFACWMAVEFKPPNDAAPCPKNDDWMPLDVIFTTRRLRQCARDHFFVVVNCRTFLVEHLDMVNDTIPISLNEVPMWEVVRIGFTMIAIALMTTFIYVVFSVVYVVLSIGIFILTYVAMLCHIANPLRSVTYPPVSDEYMELLYMLGEPIVDMFENYNGPRLVLMISTFALGCVALWKCEHREAATEQASRMRVTGATSEFHRHFVIGDVRVVSPGEERAVPHAEWGPHMVGSIN